MPTSAPHACAVPGCPGLAPRGRSRCTQHAGSTTVRTPGPHDGVYTTDRWRRLARSVVRDEPICHWCGTRRSTVADHVLELRDGGQPYDRANLVGACNPCNVAKGQRAAQRRRSTAQAQPVLISGPPCAGKTTWAHEQAALHGGTVLDWDDIWAQHTGLATHDYGQVPEQHLAGVEQAFRAQATRLVQQGGHLWLIRSAPLRRNRAMLRRIYGAQGVVLAVPAPACHARLDASARPAVAIASLHPAIDAWWAAYTPGQHELTLNPGAKPSASFPA